MSGHEWAPHEREGWSVCSRCGMVRNYDRETTTCSGALPKIRQRSEIEDCGQDGVCKLSPGCNRHWEERNRELVRENASLSSQVEAMAMRIESLAEELAKPEDVRLREVLDALDGRAVIFDGLGVRVAHLLDEMDEWIGRAGEAERMVEAARRSLSSVAESMTEHAYQELASALESPPLQPDVRAAEKTRVVDEWKAANGYNDLLAAYSAAVDEADRLRRLFLAVGTALVRVGLCRATNAKPFAAPPGGYDGQSVGSAWVRDGAVAVYCGPSDGTETTLAKSVTFVLP